MMVRLLRTALSQVLIRRRGVTATSESLCRRRTDRPRKRDTQITAIDEIYAADAIYTTDSDATLTLVGRWNVEKGFLWGRN